MDAPWLTQRPRRAGANRRAQQLRAEARTVSRLLKCFAQLQHRGCSNTILGAALASALQPAAAASAAPPPARPPGVFLVPGEPSTTAYPQPAYEAPATAQPSTSSTEPTDYNLEGVKVPVRAIRNVSQRTQ